MTTLVSSKIPLARSAMILYAPGVFHRLLEGQAIRCIERAVRAPEYFFAFFLRVRVEPMNIARYVHLLAQ